MTTREEAIEALNMTEADLVAMLPRYVEQREIKADAERFLDPLGKEIKKWLEAHPGEPLVDGERGITASLQERRGTPAYDLLTLHEKEPVLFERLLLTGCLRIDHSAVRVQGIQVSGVEKYASPTPVTTALLVKEEK